MNNVEIFGNLARDPIVRSTKTGRAVATFTVASSRIYTSQNGEQKEQTAWINVVAWGAIAERVANFCKKGIFVYIHGSLNTRSYDDNNGQRHWIMEVVADIVADPKWGEGASSRGSYSGGYGNSSGSTPNGYGDHSGGYGNNSGGFNQFGPSKPEQREESMFPEKGPQEDIPF
nr:MAG TPA: Single strand binding protein [Caudoviricetes sp.]